MAQLILAVNAGSSSLKCTLFQNNDSLDRIVSIEISGLNSSDPASVEIRKGSEKEEKEDKNIKNHDDAFRRVLQLLEKDESVPGIQHAEKIIAAHRIVHGGDFEHDVEINDETYHYLEKLEELAPLHNASALAIIQSCSRELPKAKNVACFDSVFHQTMPEAVKTYMIDPEHAKEKGLRKYGFHGISYKSILRSVSHHLQKPEEETSLIVLHLGSGASVCAIQNGKSIETSMGLTPLSGLPGSSRSGDVDPTLVFHFTSDAGQLSSKSTKELHITNAEEILNKKSGWAALTGTSDFSKIGVPSATGANRLAFDIFVDRIVGFIGNYYVKLSGKVDAIVFAGGIGERSAYLRQQVCQRCECLGLGALGNKENEKKMEGAVLDITEKETNKILVCHTDEEAEMARSCRENF
ncbi:acetate kinase [Microthyrium microscopicum]|uniref:Probable acetate kinase n=1 Tax=Microthyrium microscopicum TaxID=703497 RepID=A0A6A6UEB6_9PEZI|nr:acetate kinase [Microthyrium microscopicum]